MPVTHDLVVTTGEYQKDGQTKKRFKNIGVVMSNENGSYIILDASVNLAGLPMREGRVLVPMYAKEGQPQGGHVSQPQGGHVSQPQAGPSDLDDAIPFIYEWRI